MGKPCRTPPELMSEDGCQKDSTSINKLYNITDKDFREDFFEAV